MFWLLLLWSHALEHPKLLRIGVQTDRLLISITYDLAPGQEAQRARALFDRDSDGALNLEEQERLAVYLEKTALLWLQLKGNQQSLELNANLGRGAALPGPTAPRPRAATHDRGSRAGRP